MIWIALALAADPAPAPATPADPAASATPADPAPPADPPPRDVQLSDLTVLERGRAEFPAAAIAQGIRNAGCQVRIYIDETGTPYRALPVLCDEVFVESAVAAAMAYRFAPLVVDGVAQKAKFNLLLVYARDAKPAGLVTP